MSISSKRRLIIVAIVCALALMLAMVFVLVGCNGINNLNGDNNNIATDSIDESSADIGENTSDDEVEVAEAGTPALYWGFVNTGYSSVELWLSAAKSDKTPNQYSAANWWMSTSNGNYVTWRDKVMSVYIDTDAGTVVAPTDISGWFSNSEYCSGLYLSDLDTSNVTNMKGLFSGLNRVQDIELDN